METERRASELRDAFNGIISHELRTPITAIYGGAKLLARRDRELEPDTRRELIADLEAEADRLYRLVEDLLVLSRSERGMIERVDDPVVVQRVVERVVRSETERWPSVTFVSETQAGATARGDDTYVEQVMRNLLSNAAKYSPAGSTVRVIVDETAEGVRVRVLDEGPGFDPEETSRLFELYYRSPSTSAQSAGQASVSSSAGPSSRRWVAASGPRRDRRAAPSSASFWRDSRRIPTRTAATARPVVWDRARERSTNRSAPGPPLGCEDLAFAEQLAQLRTQPTFECLAQTLDDGHLIGPNARTAPRPQHGS